MKEDFGSEQELKAMEDEIRAYGIPFSEHEPDERYFTNFRVRLQERIDSREQKSGALASAWAWITGSTMRGLSLGGTLATVVIAAFLLSRGSLPPAVRTSVNQQPAEISQAPTASAGNEDMSVSPKESAAIIPSNETSTSAVGTSNTRSVLDEANDASDFASMDESLTGGESDDPVNYESLSESELESVVTVAQTMK